MKNSSYGDASSFPTIIWTPPILQNSIIHQRLHKFTTMVPFVNRINLFQIILLSYYFNIQFNTSLPSTVRSSKFPPYFMRFRTYVFSIIRAICPVHLILLIWYSVLLQVQIIKKFLITQLSPISSLSLRSYLQSPAYCYPLPARPRQKNYYSAKKNVVNLFFSTWSISKQTRNFLICLIWVKIKPLIFNCI